MRIAQKTKDLILTQCPNTFSLYAGYGINAGKYVRFPQGAQLSEKRNDKGRLVRAIYSYADGSRLEYRYSASRENYSLTVLKGN